MNVDAIEAYMHALARQFEKSGVPVTIENLLLVWNDSTRAGRQDPCAAMMAAEFVAACYQ